MMDTNVEKPTDVGVSGRSTVLILSVTFVIFLLTVVFGTLWLHERNRPDVVKTVTVEKIREVPVERIKEVPVEKIKEVPVEKIKEVEVPAKLSDEQKALIDLGTRMLARRKLLKTEDVLYKIPAFKIDIILDDSIKDQITEDRIRNKLELALRKSRIPIDNGAGATLTFEVYALWNKLTTQVSTSINLKVLDWVTLARDGDLRTAPVFIYQDNMIGYAGKIKIQELVLGVLDELSERFANKYLAVQEKEKTVAPTPSQ